MVPNPSYLGVLGKLSLAERTKSSTWGDFKKYLSFPHNRSQRMGGAGSVLKTSALELSSMVFSSLTPWSQVASVAPGILSVFGEEYCRRKPLNFTFK